MNGEISSIAYLVGVALAAYLVGSLPFARILSRSVFGTDLATRGSGNQGATNALRVIGPLAGGTILAIDCLKGVLAALIPGLLFPDLPGIQALAAVAAVIGHNWSIFNGFRGGRGVATGIGAGLVIYPIVVIIAVVVGTAMVLAIRYVSVGSLLGAVVAVVLGIVLYVTGLWQSPWGMIYVAIGSGLIVWRHSDNLKRLMAGQELQLAEWPTYFRRRSTPDR